MPKRKPPSIASLQSLIKRHHLTQGDLKKEIGSKSTVSLILSGKRNLTRGHIEKLSARFNVNPAIFTDPAQSSLFIGKRPRVPRQDLLDPRVEPDEAAQDALLTDVAIIATQKAEKANHALLESLHTAIQQAISCDH